MEENVILIVEELAPANNKPCDGPYPHHPVGIWFAFLPIIWLIRIYTYIYNKNIRLIFKL